VAPLIQTLVAWANASAATSGHRGGGGSFGIWFSVGLQSGVNDRSVRHVFGSFAEGGGVSDVIGELLRGGGASPLEELRRGGLALPFSSAGEGANPCIGEFCGLPAGIERFELFVFPGDRKLPPLPACPSTPFGPCSPVSMDTWFGPDILIPGGVGGRYAQRAIAARMEQTATAVVTRGAYEAAKAGGRHGGFLENYAAKSTREIQSAIRSMEENIAKHREWLRNPESKIPDFRKLDPRQQEALLNRKWPGDIQRAEEQIDVLRGILDSR
jgi:hypothetical protein